MSETNDDWKKSLLLWLCGQPFNNLLVLGLLVGGGYVVVQLVPLHIAEIQRGYERQEASHRAERELLEKEHTRQSENLMKTVESMFSNRTKNEVVNKN